MAGDNSLIGLVLFNPLNLAGLNRLVPSAVGIGLNDMLRQVRADVLARTPIGWTYVKAKTTKSGKKRTDKAGKGRWVRSDSSPGKKAKGANLQHNWEIESDKQHFSIGTSVPYAFVLEEGKYPNPPKGPLPKGKPWSSGWRVEGGYSKQAQGGLLQPIYDDPKSLDDAMDFIIEEIAKNLDSIVTTVR